MTDASERGPARRGSSGAEFRFSPETIQLVEKIGDARVADQGAMLMRMKGGEGHLPLVVSLGPNWYTMERLCPVPWRYVYMDFGDAIIDALEKGVWSRRAEVELDSNAHAEKIGGLLTNPIIERHVSVEQLNDYVSQIDWSQLRRCKAHGDPTADNCMIRPSTGELVIIDPIPATPAVPDLQVVDLGKVLTSILGFERARYGHAARIRSFILNRLSPNDFRATKYWAAVHLMRAVPYMPDERTADRVASLIPSALRF